MTTVTNIWEAIGLNFTIIWTIFSVITFFERLTFLHEKAFIFFCSQLNPVESHNTLSDYVYTKIFSSKFHASLYILLLDKESNGNSRLPLIWDCSFVLLYYNEKMILYVTRYWAIKITSWLDT